MVAHNSHDCAGGGKSKTLATVSTWRRQVFRSRPSTYLYTPTYPCVTETLPMDATELYGFIWEGNFRNSAVKSTTETPIYAESSPLEASLYPLESRGSPCLNSSSDFPLSMHVPWLINENTGAIGVVLLNSDSTGPQHWPQSIIPRALGCGLRIRTRSEMRDHPNLRAFCNCGPMIHDTGAVRKTRPVPARFGIPRKSRGNHAESEFCTNQT